MIRKQTKYKSIKTLINDIKFDSKAESDFYIQLLCQEKAGLIEIISLQPKVYLTASRILYKPDFLIKENEKLVYLDVKGFVTPIFAIKKRLWLEYGAGTLRLVKRAGKGFKVIEEIHTKIQ